MKMNEAIKLAGKMPPRPALNEIITIFIGAFGFFVGRVMVFTFVNPLMLPFLAVFIGAKKSFYITAFFVSLGLTTRLGDLFTIRYLIAVVLLCMYHYFATKVSEGNPNSFWSLKYVAAVTAFITFITGAGFSVLYGFSPFLFTITILETILAGTLVFVLKRAHTILTGRRRKVNLLSGEDIASITIILSGVIAGASDIYVGAMPLRIFFCVYILLIVSHKGNSSMAATAGLLLGFFLHLAGYWDISWAVILAIAGIGGGFAKSLLTSHNAKEYARPLVIVGVGFFGGVALFILLPSMFNFAKIYSLIAAGLAFVLTPQSFYFNVASAIDPVLDSADDYMDKIKEETTRRLNSFSSAFEKLAYTFSGLSKPKTGLNKHDISILIDELTNRACINCPSLQWCWEDDLFNTHQQVFSMLNSCSSKGKATAFDLSKDFVKECKNPENLVGELNAIFNIYRNDLRWHNRIAESRELISQQLHGVAGIVKHLSEEIDMSLRFHEGLEEEMIMALLGQKVQVSSVIVLEDKTGKYRVSINHKTCNNKKICRREILPILNKVLKRKMRVESGDCNIRNGICYSRFVEEQMFQITSAVSFKAKSKRGNGDSHSVVELKNGSCLLALSDGMGSGEKAGRESSATVGLLEDFIESGFDIELAVRMINSVLILKSSEESFSTLDICNIDLYSGRAEFIKIGAAETFLIRDGHVSIIRSSSLPIGMLNNVDLEVTERELRNGDIILMATDGVTDAEESWLKPVLKSLKYGNPQDIADHIVGEAVKRNGGKTKDDMTVLVARVWLKK